MNLPSGFKGGEYVSLPTFPAVWINGFTGCVWASFQNDDRRWERLFDIGNGQGADNILIQRYQTTTTPQFYSFIGSSASEINAPSAIVNNVFKLYCGTIDGVAQKLRIYVDGVKIIEGNGNYNNVTRVSNFIGRSNWPGATDDFRGIIDDVRFYSRTLTDTEILQLYSSAATPVVTATALTASANPALINQNVTFTANVTNSILTPNGTLTFKVDGVTKQAGSLSNGRATYATAALPVGTHAIRAEFAANTTFAASTAQLNETINGIADFIITGITLNPALPSANSTFSATVTVKNQGSSLSNGGQLRVWANQAPGQTCAVSGGDKSVAVGTLAAGVNRNFTFTGLAAGGSGVKTLRAFVDAACTTVELNENNNQQTKIYRVAGRNPDFVVSNIVLTPVIPVANSTFTAAVTIRNIGTVVGNTGYLDVWANQSTVQTCGAAGDAWVDVGVVAAGEMKTVNFTLSTGGAGTKFLRAYLDSWCETVESNEMNNQIVRSYTVQ